MPDMYLVLTAPRVMHRGAILSLCIFYISILCFYTHLFDCCIEMVQEFIHKVLLRLRVMQVSELPWASLIIL